MGGHGTSYYSGLPQITERVCANNTQRVKTQSCISRAAGYVLKNYLGYLTKGKPSTDSVKYIARLQDLARLSSQARTSWTLEKLRDVLAKSLLHSGTIIGATESQTRRQGETEMDIVNHKVGTQVAAVGSTSRHSFHG
jgi:hypothetical protein